MSTISASAPLDAHSPAAAPEAGVPAGTSGTRLALSFEVMPPRSAAQQERSGALLELLASYDPALEDHLVWEGPHFAPDIPDTLNVPPPTTTLPEVVMSEEETAPARLSEQFRARAAQAGQHGDAFHLPDFGPDEVDETQQLLNSLRGRGQQAIRSGLQSYLN